MNAPRLELRLDRIAHNATELVSRLDEVGISVCAVTKAALGAPELARVLLAAGAHSLGDSRIENVQRLRRAGIDAEIMLVRSPMVSQAVRVVNAVDVSLVSEPAVMEALSRAALDRGHPHGVVLMVELGDLREGIVADRLAEVLESALGLPGLVVRGIGTNLACQSGIIPDAANMAALSDLATASEERFGVEFDIVSGGNSANLDWAFDPHSEIGRINHLRLGESILLGREPTHRKPIVGLRTDTATLVAEVIESAVKPTMATGRVGETAFGAATSLPEAQPATGAAVMTNATARRVIVALGRQDTDVDGLSTSDGSTVLGASSDHLIVGGGTAPYVVGDEVRFDLTYSALMRAMTSPFVSRCFLTAPRT